MIATQEPADLLDASSQGSLLSCLYNPFLEADTDDPAAGPAPQPLPTKEEGRNTERDDDHGLGVEGEGTEYALGNDPIGRLRAHKEGDQKAAGRDVDQDGAVGRFALASTLDKREAADGDDHTQDRTFLSAVSLGQASQPKNDGFVPS